MDEQGFESMDGGADYGEPSVSAAEIARSAARAAVAGRQQAAQPGERFNEGPVLESEEQLISTFEEAGAEEGEEISLEPVVDLEPSVLTDEDMAALNEFGIELPMSPDAVPAEFKDPYARMAQTIVQVQRDAEAKVSEVARQNAELIETMTDLRARFSTAEGQERLLLTLALTNPDVVQQVYSKIERMNQDAEYKEAVQTKLEAVAQLEAARRIERANRAATNRSKGQQIEDRTLRLAKRFGVDEGFAREMIAGRILQNAARNGGVRDISIQEVDEIMTNLAKRMGKQPPKPTRQPAAQQRQVQAPKPVAGNGTPRAPEQQPAPKGPQGVPSNDPLDALRSAVRRSAQSQRGKGL